MVVCIRRTILVFACFATLLTGCNSNKVVKVHGKILKNGQPMVVSEDTYVTLSFVAETATQGAATSKSAKFEQKTGTYTIELPPGKYKTMLVIALPSKKNGVSGPGAPSKPFQPDTVHDLTKDQELNIDVP